MVDDVVQDGNNWCRPELKTPLDPKTMPLGEQLCRLRLIILAAVFQQSHADQYTGQPRAGTGPSHNQRP